MVYSRQEEIRIILRALRGEPDENQYKHCTRCQSMGRVCLDCPVPIRYKPWASSPTFDRRSMSLANTPLICLSFSLFFHHLLVKTHAGACASAEPYATKWGRLPWAEQATNPSKSGCSSSSAQVSGLPTFIPYPCLQNFYRYRLLVGSTFLSPFPPCSLDLII